MITFDFLWGEIIVHPWKALIEQNRVQVYKIFGVKESEVGALIL